MKDQSTALDFTGEDIYVGIDVHLNSWTVSIYTSHLEHKTFRQDPLPEVLMRYLRRHFPGAHYHGVYEAGYCGFWIYEALKEAGMEMMVINAADVPTTECERTYKHDAVEPSQIGPKSSIGRAAPDLRTIARGRRGQATTAHAWPARQQANPG